MEYQVDVALGRDALGCLAPQPPPLAASELRRPWQQQQVQVVKCVAMTTDVIQENGRCRDTSPACASAAERGRPRPSIGGIVKGGTRLFGLQELLLAGDKLDEV
jgi:hypothetical protein